MLKKGRYDMPNIRVVNKRNHQCSRCVYVGRPTPLGNKYTHISDRQTLAKFVVASRDEAVDRYKADLDILLQQPTCCGRTPARWAFDNLVDLARHGELHLQCWCDPQRCHAHALKDRIEQILLREENP